jgi:superfamily II DNA or RNA helicase
MNEKYEPIQRAVQMLAGVCDYASTRDGHGFNGGDAEFGHAMAEKEDFSPRMVLALKKMLPKYHVQLGEELVAQIRAIEVDTAPPQAPATASKPAASAVTAPATVDLNGPLNVETLLPWGAPQEISTRNGAKIIRKAMPDQNFWNLWRSRREEIKALGVTVFKNNSGQFEATLWPPRNIEPIAAPQDDSVPAQLAVSADIAKKLLPFQVQAVGRIASSIERYRAALDASDTGTGKTYIALAACKQLGLKPIVICPKSVRPSWLRAADHFGMEIFVTNYEQYKMGKTTYCVVSKVPRLKKDGTPQLDKKTLKPIIDTIFKWNIAENEIIVVDECHRIGARDSLNADMSVAAKEVNAKILLLSATAADSPLALYAIGYILGLFKSPKAYFGWMMKNGVSRGRFGLEFTGGQATMKNIHAQIFGRGKGSRLRIADIPDFPETSIFPEVIDFDNSAEIQQAYDDMADALSHLDEVEKKDRQGIILTEILRARQRTELLKVPTLAKMVEDAIAEGMSVAVFVNFDESLLQLAALLKTDCTISGRQQGAKGEAEREANIQRFQRGNFPRLSIINVSYSAKAVKQALGRVHRAFDKNERPQWSDDCSRVIICNINAGGVGVSLHHLGGLKSIQRIPFAAGTVEEDACLAVEKKVANIEMLNNGDILNGLKIVGCDVNELELKAA